VSVLSRPQSRTGRALKALVIPKALWDNSSPTSRVVFFAAVTISVLGNIRHQNVNGAQAREIIGQNEIIVRQQNLIKSLQKHLAAATS
jgi:hypothetical protein